MSVSLCGLTKHAGYGLTNWFYYHGHQRKKHIVNTTILTVLYHPTKFTKYSGDGETKRQLYSLVVNEFQHH